MNNMEKIYINKFHKLPFDGDMLSEWIKTLRKLKVTSKFLRALQMAVVLIVKKFIIPKVYIF